jgi:broad specificity phosphatase PhoE
VTCSTWTSESPSRFGLLYSESAPRFQSPARYATLPFAPPGRASKREGPLSSNPLRIFLLRHAETDWNRARRVQGVSDIPLNARGRAQAEAFADRLATEPLEAIYASPLSRARETAEALARRHGLPIQTVEGLSEFHQGELEGRHLEDLIADYPDLLAAFSKDPADVRIPGGETMAEVQVRAWAAFSEIVDRHTEGSVVVVSHNMTLLTLLCRFLGMTLSRFRRLSQGSTGVTILERGVQGLHIRVMNDQSHLPAELRS